MRSLLDHWETYTHYIEYLVMSNYVMGQHDDFANGPHSLGGFKGRASKKNAKWKQKGANKKSAGKSSSSVTLPIQIFAAMLVGIPALTMVGLIVFVVMGHVNA